MADRRGRRSIRLPGFDYTQPGGYFVTTCTHMRKDLFGVVTRGEVLLSAAGRIAARCWARSLRSSPKSHWMHGLSCRTIFMASSSWVVGAKHSESKILAFRRQVPRMLRPYPHPHAGQDPDRWPPPFKTTNRSPQDKSTTCAELPAPRFGNGIITSM